MLTQRKISKLKLSKKSQVIDLDFMIGYVAFAMVLLFLLVGIANLAKPFNDATQSQISERNQMIFASKISDDMYLSEFESICTSDEENIRATYRLFGLNSPGYDKCTAGSLIINRKGYDLEIIKNTEQDVSITFFFPNYVNVESNNTNVFNNKIVNVYLNSNETFLEVETDDSFFIQIASICFNDDCDSHLLEDTYISCIPVKKTCGSQISGKKYVARKYVNIHEESSLLPAILNVEVWYE